MKIKFILTFLFIPFFFIFGNDSLKVLHLSFHKGCILEIEYIAQKLGLDLTTINVTNVDPEWFCSSKGSGRYNITHNRAQQIWKKNSDFFNQFDLIITSDTAPLSRIFLQNNFSKPLIIWVCNRFDYCYTASLREVFPESFPDKEYYQLIRTAPKNPNVAIVSYTPFEHIYAKKYHNMDTWNKVIKPTGYGTLVQTENSSLISTQVDRSQTFFIPSYHNDTIMMNLSEKCTQLQIPNYSGKYAGPNDLQGFKGIIHIPYAWSNLALFENWTNGLIYFIPSLNFLKKISRSNSFFWSPPYDVYSLQYSEWYDPDHKELFVYFDSWEDLQEKIKSTNYDMKKQQILEFSDHHNTEMINRWKSIILEVVKNE